MVIKIIEGEKVYFYEKVTTTMEVAKQLINNNETGIIVAKTQISGRGRYGRKWISSEGGLYLSWVIDKKNKILDIMRISALSIIKTLENFGIKNCKIKLPNDIIIKDKKISGILLEKIGNKLILGIGINLNNEGEKIGEYAISFKDIKKQEIKIESFLVSFIKEFKSIFIHYYINPSIYLKKWSELLTK